MRSLKHSERLLRTRRTRLCRRLHLQHVEADGLGERAALADGDDVTVLDQKGW